MASFAHINDRKREHLIEPQQETGIISNIGPLSELRGLAAGQLQCKQSRAQDPSSDVASLRGLGKETAGAGSAQHQDWALKVAKSGIRGSGQSLPHLEQIQAAFGKYDVGNVRAHIGSQASEAATQIGAKAFAMGEHIAFDGYPDLHTAAHEAAHVVQQRAGISLRGGMGQAGDKYENHADAVADLVVKGQSAEALLGAMAGTASAKEDKAPKRNARKHRLYDKALNEYSPLLTKDPEWAFFFLNEAFTKTTEESQKRAITTLMQRALMADIRRYQDRAGAALLTLRGSYKDRARTIRKLKRITKRLRLNYARLSRKDTSKGEPTVLRSQFQSAYKRVRLLKTRTMMANDHATEKQKNRISGKTALVEAVKSVPSATVATANGVIKSVPTAADALVSITTGENFSGCSDAYDQSVGKVMDGINDFTDKANRKGFEVDREFAGLVGEIVASVIPASAIVGVLGKGKKVRALLKSIQSASKSTRIRRANQLRELVLWIKNNGPALQIAVKSASRIQNDWQKINHETDPYERINMVLGIVAEVTTGVVVKDKVNRSLNRQVSRLYPNAEANRRHAAKKVKQYSGRTGLNGKYPENDKQLVNATNRLTRAQADLEKSEALKGQKGDLKLLILNRLVVNGLSRFLTNAIVTIGRAAKESDPMKRRVIMGNLKMNSTILTGAALATVVDVAITQLDPPDRLKPVLKEGLKRALEGTIDYAADMGA